MGSEYFVLIVRRVRAPARRVSTTAVCPPDTSSERANRAPNLTKARSKSGVCRDEHFARSSARFVRNGAARPVGNKTPQCLRDTTNSFPGRHPSLHHDFPQCLIDPRLVATALLLEPGQHIGVQTQGDRPLDRSVQPPHIGDQIVRPLRLRG
jgi:hypothetical protein